MNAKVVKYKTASIVYFVKTSRQLSSILNANVHAFHNEAELAKSQASSRSVISTQC